MAIVSAGNRYVGLFCVEAPEVRFEDTVKVTVEGADTVHLIDPTFVDVCEPGSLLVVGVSTPRPAIVGAEVTDNLLRIRVSGEFPPYVVVKISGARAHRNGLRFPEFTEEEMRKNNAFWSQARK